MPVSPEHVDASAGPGDGGRELSPVGHENATDRLGKERILPTDLFRQSLSDAEELLSFAVQTGRLPEGAGRRDDALQWIVDGVIDARVAVETDTLTKPIAAAFWTAFADLSRITRPVTAAALRTPGWRGSSHLTVFVAALLALLVPASLFLSVHSSVANQVGHLIGEQNTDALRLWSQVQRLRADPAPQGAPGELFAATTCCATRLCG